MNKLLSAALATALLSMSSASQAAPITLTGSIADGSWLGAGHHAGAFDGSAVLPQHYKINSASFVFNFADDQDTMSSGQPLVTGSSATAYNLLNYSWDSQNYYYTYLRTKTTSQSVAATGQAESALVSLGGVDVGSGATDLWQGTSQNTIYDGRTAEGGSYSPGYWQGYSCGNRCGGSYWVYGNSSNYFADNVRQVTTFTSDWKGNFSVAGDITNLAILQQLLASNKLDWDLLVGGDLNLSNARLNLDVEEIVPAADVPEPSSLLLLALGLLGLSFKRRGRHSQ